MSSPEQVLRREDVTKEDEAEPSDNPENTILEARGMRRGRCNQRGMVVSITDYYLT
jgi:hypothetical protein